MSSLDELRKSIESQPSRLAEYCKELHGTKYDCVPLELSQTILTGSGDSYSAALFASELSRGRSRAIDPYELSKKPWLARDKHIVIISVSGKTKTNIELARKLRRVARMVLAITSDAESPLALNCTHTILLNYQGEGVPTAGASSYTSSLLACAFVLGTLPKRVEIGKSLVQAWIWAKRSAKELVPSAFTVVGSGFDYACGYYGALKLNEVLGLPARCQHPEEFGHAYLFSIKKTDTIVCVNPGLDKKTGNVFEAMRKSGFATLRIQSSARDPILRSIGIAFHFQCFAYLLARKIGLRKCAFLSDRDRLSTSSGLIY